MSDTPDYIFDAYNWDCTHAWEDRDELFYDLPCGEVMEVGCLKKLPNKFAVQVYNEEEDIYEIKMFDRKEDAEKAIPQALKEREL